MVTNQHGEPIRFLITPANVADNNPKVLSLLLTGLKCKCYGDKGHLSSLLEELLEESLHLVARLRRNMKNMLITLQDKMGLLKRGRHRGCQRHFDECL
ncbi:hypothetical protein GCM10028895_31350 [Pontibacter rugosus]